MKRSHGSVSSTPLFFLKKGRTSSRQQGLLGTPVEGLTGMPVDTPDSDDRPARAIPDTTQRRLEGFCLNTPLTLSQAAEQETPTLIKEQTAQHEEPQQQQQQQHPALQQQQQQHRGQHIPSSLKKQQPPQHPGPAGLQTAQGRHRLANISNLPPGSPPATASAPGDSPQQQQQPDSSHAAAQPMTTGATTGRKKRGHHVLFQPGLTSPQPSLLAPASSSRTGGTAGAASASAWTPYPSSSQGPYGSSLAGTPGSCAGDDDDGFVLFTSQSYVRQSQPAISPSFAAGLSAAPEEEPTTTPSQDSREPRPSPSHATTTTTTTDGMSFDLPQSLAPGDSEAAAVTAAAAEEQPGLSLATSSHQQQAQEQLPQQQPLTGSQLTAPCAVDAHQRAAAAAAAGGTTPGDGLGMLGIDLLEETTTPELEQIGLASQECGSQQQLAAPGSGAAAAAAAGAGAGSSRAARGGGAGGRGTRGSGVVCEEVTAKQMLFPVFRPLKDRKCVILVRHGESTYNKQDAHGKSWSDPQLFDAPLTQRGRQQAIGARDRVAELLKKHGHLGNTLWVSSPLTRALETMTLAAPQVEQLAAAQQAVGAPKVVVTSIIAEHCATTGDVGRPASLLRDRFPALVSAMEDLQEVWWFNPAPEEHPNCALTRVFNKVESADCMRRRVSEFGRWLTHRPEKVVVAFGHSTFWKYFSNSKTRMRNCEVVQLWW